MIFSSRFIMFIYLVYLFIKFRMFLVKQLDVHIRRYE